jgi:hypothetical protein
LQARLRKMLADALARHGLEPRMAEAHRKELETLSADAH